MKIGILSALPLAALPLAASECTGCHNLPTWHAEACYPGTIVSDGQKVYRLSWEEVGPCCGEETDTVDCSGVYKWSPHVDYAAAKGRVHYRGSLFVARDPAVGTDPGQDLIGWKNEGVCTKGTDSLMCDPEASGLGEVGERRLCACCEGCATRDGVLPTCLDSVSRVDCFETWCPSYNSIDPDTCKAVIEQGQLNWWTKPLGPATVEWPAQIVAPYVDVTFDEDVPRFSKVMAETGVKHFIMAFLTVQTDSPDCEIRWAGVHNVTVGTSWLDTETGERVHLYDEIRKVREMGGDVIASFGGAGVNEEAADHAACQKIPAEELYQKYVDVVKFLNVTAIDFDISADRLGMESMITAWNIRFEAARKLRAEFPNLQIWWTLPVGGNGLSVNGELFLSNLIEKHVPKNKMNLLTMNYGNSCAHKRPDNSPDMFACEQAALESVVDTIWLSIGQMPDLDLEDIGLVTRDDTYKFLGSTPMIGLNNNVQFRYTLDDAKASTQQWQQHKRLSLVSQWSLARDAPCQEDSQALATCSGANLQSDKYQYVSIFNQII